MFRYGRVMVSPEPKSQLRQFSSSAGIRVVLAPPMVTAPPDTAASSAASAAGAHRQSTAASTSAAARRTNPCSCFTNHSSS